MAASQGVPCHRCGRAGPERLQAHGIGHRRRLPALVEPGDAEHHGEAGGDDVDGHARDDLVAAVADAREAVQPRQGDADRHRQQQRDPDRAEGRAGSRRCERGEEHLAFEADVDHARALRQHAGQRAEDERRRHAQGRGEQGADEDGIHVRRQGQRPTSPSPGAGGARSSASPSPPPVPPRRPSRPRTGR